MAETENELYCEFALILVLNSWEQGEQGESELEAYLMWLVASLHPYIDESEFEDKLHKLTKGRKEGEMRACEWTPSNVGLVSAFGVQV